MHKSKAWKIDGIYRNTELQTYVKQKSNAKLREQDRKH